MNTSYFIRHTESKHAQLTSLGIREAVEHGTSSFGKIIASQDFLLHTPPAKRFTDTATLMIYPESDSVEMNTKALIDSGTLCLDVGLDYTQFNNHERDIEKLFDIQAKKGILMQDFYIQMSDSFLLRNPKLSTYSTISRFMCKKVLDISRPHSTHANIVVTREFFWPVFRAKIMEIKDSVAAAREFASWHSAHKENNLLARLDVNVLIRNDDDWVLQDDYGTYHFTTNIIKQVCAT